MFSQVRRMPRSIVWARWYVPFESLPLTQRAEGQPRLDQCFPGLGMRYVEELGVEVVAIIVSRQAHLRNVPEYCRSMFAAFGRFDCVCRDVDACQVLGHRTVGGAYPGTERKGLRARY